MHPGQLAGRLAAAGRAAERVVEGGREVALDLAPIIGSIRACSQGVGLGCVVSVAGDTLPFLRVAKLFRLGRLAGKASTVAVELPTALRGGEATTHVYFGTRKGKRVYVGITNDIPRRQGQHGPRFDLEEITEVAVTRGQARAIEQALIVRNPGFENLRNEISPKHSWYEQAVAWGENWLTARGI